MYRTEIEHEVTQIEFALDMLLPGIICRDSTCPQAGLLGVPHMATDMAGHPHPYGAVSDPTHEWRRKTLFRRALGRHRSRRTHNLVRKASK